MAQAGDLNADVKAFAAQLGLGGGESVNDFSDFDPKKAQKRIGKPEKAVKKDAVPRKDAKGKPSPKAPAKDTGRPQGGAGGEQRGSGPPARSILPRDEPGIWHEAASVHWAGQPKPSGEADPAVVQRCKAVAEKLLRNEEAAAADGAGHRGSEAAWLAQARRAGTTADRVAAASVSVQDGGLGVLGALDMLLDMARKRGGARGAVGATVEALTELFLRCLLPDRRLRFFEQQPLDALALGRRPDDLALLYYHFEDCIKKRFAEFVEALEAGSKDNLEFIKERSLRAMYQLLSKKPEQEQRLLSSLVNKLGDPERKLASKSGHLLSRLLGEHPAMSLVVVREIERFVFRPGLSDRARYYAVVYLNQLVLSHAPGPSGPDLAKKLIGIYFTLFAMIMDGKIGTAAQLRQESTAKAASNGKTHASKGAKGHGKHKGSKKGKAGSKSAPATTTHAMVGQTGELDARMLSALITGARRAFPYVSAEDIEPLIAQHADALFRLVHTRSFGVATQSLLLLFQLMTARGASSDRFYRALYAVLSSPDLCRSTKAPMFLGLVLKAVQADSSHKRAASFVKRLLQIALEAPANFACGCLILVSELTKTRPGLWHAVLQAEESAKDSLEQFRDVNEDEASEDPSPAGDNEPGDESGEDGPVASHSFKPQPADNGAGERWPDQQGAYDPSKRDPLYANGDASCLWELACLARHVHPSVAAMASTLLAGTTIVYSGDPLRDLTATAFLDKFVTRGTKRAGAARGASAMQPLPPAVVASAGGHGPDLAALAEADVAPEDVFFTQYYALKGVQERRAAAAARKARKKAAAGDGDEEDEELLSDVESDEADEFLEGEEEGGDEGIGADPDRHGKYDYDEMDAAMLEESDASSSDDDRAVEAAQGSSSDEEAASSDNDDDDAASELEGGSFSDMSDEEDASSSDGEQPDASRSIRGRATKAAKPPVQASGSDDDASLDDDDDDDMFDLGEDSEDEDGEQELASLPSSSEGEPSSSDDEAADAEVAVMLATVDKQSKNRKKQREDLVGGADLNPFEVPEPSSSDDDSDSEDQRVSSSRRAGAAMPARPAKRKSKDLSSDFAPLEDYEHLLTGSGNGDVPAEAPPRKPAGGRKQKKLR